MYMIYFGLFEIVRDKYEENTDSESSSESEDEDAKVFRYNTCYFIIYIDSTGHVLKCIVY